MKQETSDRAIRAKNILQHPDFEQLRKDVESDVFNQFRRTNVLNIDEREEVHKLIYALDMLVKRMQFYIDTAEFEAKESEEE